MKCFACEGCIDGTVNICAAHEHYEDAMKDIILLRQSVANRSIVGPGAAWILSALDRIIGNSNPIIETSNYCGD